MLRLAAATSAATLALTTLSLLPAQADPVDSAGAPTGPAAGPATAVTAATGEGTDTTPAPDADAGLTETRTPTFTSGLHATVQEARPADAALAFLQEREDEYGIPQPRVDLQPVGTSSSGGQTAVRLAQSYHGIPVLGAEYLVRMHDHGDHAVVTGSSGRYFTGLDVDLGSGVDPSMAALVARHDLRRTVRGLQVHDDGAAVVPFGSGVLTRHLTVTGTDVRTGLPVRKELFVAAGRSHPVLAYDGIDYDEPVSTTGAGYHGNALPIQATRTSTAYVLRDTTRGGGISTLDAGGADVNRFFYGAPKGRLVSSPTVPFPASTNSHGAIDAHWGAARVYDFYAGLGRDGLDGHGGEIRSYVNVTAGGDDFPNAFWDGQEMVFGNGGYGYKPFAAALDVVGHEMTHGVVQHTAGLLGFGQSGALNEGIADYFGNSIENAALGIGADDPRDGLMGQDLCLHRAPQRCADRNLDRVRTTRQFFGDPFDSGGVHANSTIVSGAFWQLRRIFGGDQVADHRADEVMYTALTQYLTPLSDFLDARRAVVQAAADLHATPDELGQIREAFDVRGVRAGWERRDLHVDSTPLYPGMSLGYGLSVAHGRWAIVDMGPKGLRLPTVYVGALHVTGHRVLSPSTFTAYDSPAIDGRAVAWSATDLRTGLTRVQVRSVRGGPVRTLATYRPAVVWSLALDGSTAAWDVGTRHGEHLVIQRPGGDRHVVPVKRGHFIGKVAVRGHRVVWSDNSVRRKDAARLLSYNARTGTTHVLATVHSTGPLPAAVYGPVLSRHHVYYAADRSLRTLRTQVVRLDRSGRKHVVIPASSRHAPVFPELAASDKAVTFSTMTSWHLYQVPASGGPLRRVSCATGPQMSPVAGAGKRVVWTELTTGDDDLVTRARPAGPC
jgi:Zn-dependent metalloprotease